MRRFLVLSCLLLTPALLFGQTDRHFAAARLAQVAQRSVFLHGYLHGYEEGFHQADFDLQMGRIARGEYLRDGSPTGYYRQFGSRHMYNAGYHAGFGVGYSDGAAGRAFRAVDTVLANGEIDAAVNPALFDDGIRAGYIAGQHRGLDDARSQRSAAPSPTCPAAAGQNQEQFCGAYKRGFGMGYADGYLNQAKPTTEAKK